MARYTRQQVLATLYDQRILPIFYHSSSDVCQAVARGCATGGLSIIEFTNRGDGAFQTFSELLTYCSKHLPEMILGAGSIIDAATAALYINQGANFIVAPHFDPEVARICNKRKIPYIPGCGSVSEIVTALEVGVEFIKLFPAREVGGPAFVKAVKGPLPWVSVVATGGVEIDSTLNDWLDAGVDVIGLGSGLFSKADLASKDEKAITAKVKKALAAVRGVQRSATSR